jgi:hypothetical protein
MEIPAARLPIVAEADVVVTGGGTAGYIAAVAAARSGAKTVLIERNGFLGGSATGTYNTNLSSSYDSDGNRIMGGVPWEAIERLAAAGGAYIREIKNGRRTHAEIFPETTKTVALEMVYEAGVDLYLHTWASDCLMENGSVRGIIVQNKSGRQIVLGKTFVDASADADIAYKAGAPFEQLDVDHSYLTTLDLTVCNIDVDKVLRWVKDNADRLETPKMPDNIEDNEGIKSMVEFVVKGPRKTKLPDGSTYRPGRALGVKMLIRRSICRVQGHVEIDGTDVKQLTWAEYEGRRQALEELNYLRENVPGFEDAFVVAQSPLGVRETRRVKGEYWLTLQDLDGNTRHPDVVGLNCRPVDKHMKNDEFSIRMLMGNHDIPLRALIPQNVRNLLVAGRCISSDHDANASLRGGGTCMITGHAAGTAAALASRGNGQVRDVDIALLQRTLLDQGAILSTDPGRRFV